MNNANERMEIISFSIPKGILDRIDERASLNRRSRSSEITFTLEKSLEKE